MYDLREHRQTSQNRRFIRFVCVFCAILFSHPFQSQYVIRYVIYHVYEKKQLSKDASLE